MGNGDDFLLRVVYRVNSNAVTRLRLIELLTKHTRDNVDTVLLSGKNLFQKGLYAVFYRSCRLLDLDCRDDMRTHIGFHGIYYQVCAVTNTNN